MNLISLARLRRSWERLRPLPTPRYVTPTPRVSDAFQNGVYQNPNAMTLAAASLSEEAISFMEGLIGRMTRSDELAGQQAWYKLARAQFGKHLRFADLTTALWAASTLIRPSAYLEIGVRTGRSACVIAATNPECAILGFDLWLEDYAGVPNPGPDFVRSELATIGHSGSVELLSGDSRETVPAYLAEHPDAFFDVITVDGDHTVLGAANDLANVLPRLKVGGILLFDDIVRAPALRSVWERLVVRDSRYVTWEYTDAGDGVAAAIRIGDAPMLHWGDQ